MKEARHGQGEASVLYPIYKFQVEYYVNSTISFGARVTAGTIHDIEYKVTNQSDVTVSEKYISLGNFGTYFLREKSGMRPYFRLGADALRVTRNKVELNPQDFYYPEYGSIAKVKATCPQITAEFGFELEFGASTPFYPGIYLFASDHLEDTELLRLLISGIGVRAGVNFWHGK